MERVEILINEKILGDLERNCNGNRSEFIRVAIEEKLSRKKSDDNEILKILRQMDRLDPNAIHEDVTSLIIAVGTVFEATQKQKRLSWAFFSFYCSI